MNPAAVLPKRAGAATGRRRERRIAILGAGIMGTSLALFLARRGAAVWLFDRERAPMCGASRWNEGKIHLGYLYGADPTLDTARRILPGGLAFGALVSELIGTDVSPAVTERDDLFLIHRDSVAGPDAVAGVYRRIDDLVRSHPDAGHYLADLSAAASRRLSAGEIAGIADPEVVVGGFRAPERSVDTGWIADRMCEAVRSEPRIDLRMSTTITAAHPAEGETGVWRLRGTPDLDERFDLVVNALWHGRLAIDSTAGLPLPGSWSNRLRYSLFVRTGRELDLPNATVAVGPFGDVKNYTGRNFYLSWYPAGLVADTDALCPPLDPVLEPEFEARLVAGVRAGLSPILPWTGDVLDAADRILVRGGYVFAQGKGSLSDPGSELHRRDRFGTARRGAYVSVDTGKYSTAPWLARRLAAEIMAA